MNTEFFKKLKLTTKEKLATNMTLVWFILFSVNTLCSSMMAGLAGKYWSQMNPEDRFIMVVAIVMNWTGSIQAFLYQAINRVQHGGGLLPPETVTPETKS